ncbi:MAG: hypothetical protein K2K54_05835 [Lachnospiraceae bacterium]|nr:hypothetical protein [Lachnospiraceae bacterium]
MEKGTDLRTAITADENPRNFSSISTLGSYESDDYKEILHRNIADLAKFYEVSVDYLLGLTEHWEEILEKAENLRVLQNKGLHTYSASF